MHEIRDEYRPCTLSRLLTCCVELNSESRLPIGTFLISEEITKRFLTTAAHKYGGVTYEGEWTVRKVLGEIGEEVTCAASRIAIALSVAVLVRLHRAVDPPTTHAIAHTDSNYDDPHAHPLSSSSPSCSDRHFLRDWYLSQVLPELTSLTIRHFSVDHHDEANRIARVEWIEYLNDLTQMIGQEDYEDQHHQISNNQRRKEFIQIVQKILTQVDTKWTIHGW